MPGIASAVATYVFPFTSFRTHGLHDPQSQYYEAIGPLPPRLQPPLWASPPPTPAAGPSSRHHQDASAVASHKAAISRHRYDWDRAKTPPGYWNIGFPDTQEVEGINEKAKEMHRKKREMVEKEAKCVYALFLGLWWKLISFDDTVKRMGGIRNDRRTEEIIEDSEDTGYGMQLRWIYCSIIFFAAQTDAHSILILIRDWGWDWEKIILSKTVYTASLLPIVQAHLLRLRLPAVP
jgi:hypothetical protein